jgi:D-alanyl-D-alanine carboxypeptidase
MRALAAAIVLVGAYAGSVCSVSAASSGPSLESPIVRNAIVAAVEKDRKLYGGRTPVPGVLVGVWDGAGHSFIRPFGYANLAGHRAMTAADHFRIGSNTKTFVVAVILQLVDEGKITLDEPLSRFSLGVTIPNAANITVRELCDMRSGLFEAYNTPQFERMNVSPQAIFDPRTVIRWAVAQKPYFAPNKGYHYTNTGYLILGLIIENITHEGVGDQIRKRLLVPFGLAQTSYPETMAMPDPWARGYGLDNRRNWEDVSNTIPVSLMGAAGAMISDMADMKRWIELYVSGKTSSPATHRALMDCIPTGASDAGFGLALGCSKGWYGYTGGLPGYNTANFYFPKSGIFITAWVDVQVNKPAPGAANAMFRDIARILTPNDAPLSSAGGL